MLPSHPAKIIVVGEKEVEREDSERRKRGRERKKGRVKRTEPKKKKRAQRNMQEWKRRILS